jgi:hypothetical protein
MHNEIENWTGHLVNVGADLPVCPDLVMSVARMFAATVFSLIRDYSDNNDSRAHKGAHTGAPLHFHSSRPPVIKIPKT